MKSLSQVVKEKDEIAAKRAALIETHNGTLAALNKELTELDRLEKLATTADLDISKIQMAEKVIYCHGDVDNVVEGRKLTDAAATDIANGHPHLAQKVFGNKRYEGFYQQCDSEYGYGPRHGSIVDCVGMLHESRGQVLCDEEKDAIIYYLKNYSRIKALKPA